MAERYSRLFTLGRNLYTNGSPVLVSAGAILKDSETDTVLAQLKFQNICEKVIKAVKVRIIPQDTAGRLLNNAVEYQYLDLSIHRDMEFGDQIPIYLQNNITRAFTVEVQEVIFADNSIWTAPGDTWEPLLSAQTLDDYFEDVELVRQYRLKFGNDCSYAPSVTQDLWICSCGAINRNGKVIAIDAERALHI